MTSGWPPDIIIHHQKYNLNKTTSAVFLELNIDGELWRDKSQTTIWVKRGGFANQTIFTDLPAIGGKSMNRVHLWISQKFNMISRVAETEKEH